MNTCDNCKGTGVEPEADGLTCQACKANNVPSWVNRTGPTSKNATNTVNVVGGVADSVSDFFLWSAVGDIASAVGSGLGTAAECAGDVVGAVAECAGDVIGAVLD